MTARLPVVPAVPVAQSVLLEAMAVLVALVRAAQV